MTLKNHFFLLLFVLSRYIDRLYKNASFSQFSIERDREWALRPCDLYFLPGNSCHSFLKNQLRFRNHAFRLSGRRILEDRIKKCVSKDKILRSLYIESHYLKIGRFRLNFIIIYFRTSYYYNRANFFPPFRLQCREKYLLSRSFINNNFNNKKEL